MHFPPNKCDIFLKQSFVKVGREKNNFGKVKAPPFHSLLRVQSSYKVGGQRLTKKCGRSLLLLTSPSLDHKTTTTIDNYRFKA